MLPRIVILILFLGFMLWRVPYGMGYFVNVTPSYPYGIYKLDRGFDSNADKFRLVMFCPFGQLLEAPYNTFLPVSPITHCDDSMGYAPLFKRVVAIHGDTVESTDDYIIVNGFPTPYTKRIAVNSDGDPLPKPDRSKYTLRDSVWVLSTYSSISWDSRYYGPVPLNKIIGVVNPVWTW